jgi:hypothetical protein
MTVLEDDGVLRLKIFESIIRAGAVLVGKALENLTTFFEAVATILGNHQIEKSADGNQRGGRSLYLVIPAEKKAHPAYNAEKSE